MTTHGADLWEDGYPHGTVEGFLDGCRGSVCPGETDWGMSCKRAKLLAAGDYRYKKLVADGRTPAEIAAIIDGRNTPTPTPTEPQTILPTPKETPAMTEPTPVPKPAPPKKPLTVTPVPDIDDALAEEPAAAKPEKKRSAPAPAPASGRTKEQLAAIRQWAHETGVTVGSRGLIPNRVILAYDEATRDAAQPLAESANDSEPQEDTGDPVVEAEAPTAPSEPAAEDEAMGHPTSNDYTDALDEARDRAHTATPEEIAADVNAKLAKAVDQMSPDITGLADIFDIPAEVLDESGGTYPTAAAIEQAVVAEILSELPALEDELTAAAITRTARIVANTGPQPEWAAVTVPAEISKLREIIMMLEEEYAEAIRQRDEARTALAVTLTKWDHERHNAGAYRILHQIARTDAQQAWGTADRILEQLHHANTRNDAAARHGFWGRIFG